jgi:hypothetical protein
MSSRRRARRISVLMKSKVLESVVNSVKKTFSRDATGGHFALTEWHFTTRIAPRPEELSRNRGERACHAKIRDGRQSAR